jgi:hypothetical protein
MVWGIDRQWAVRALSSSGSRVAELVDLLIGRGVFMRVPDGRYSVSVRITDRYRRLFDVSAKQASAHLRATVRNCCRHGRPPRGIFKAQSRRRPSAAERSVSTIADPDPSMLPDLAAMPAWNIGVFSHRHRDLLSFASTEWNAGPGGLVVEGFRHRSRDVMHAFQYFYDDSGTPVSRAPVGAFHFDGRNGHNHWHFQQFARYTLTKPGGRRVASEKQSFCIGLTDPVDLTVPGAVWQPDALGLRSACGRDDSIWIRESLQPGWGDTYLQYVAGQAIDVTHVPNGSYRLKVEVNPEGKLYERTEGNDVASGGCV